MSLTHPESFAASPPALEEGPPHESWMVTGSRASRGTGMTPLFPSCHCFTAPSAPHTTYLYS